MIRFESSLDPPDLAAYTAAQMNHLFPDGGEADAAALLPAVREALGRVHDCFRHIRRKYYREGDQVRFDHLHADHAAAFLYLLGNTLYARGADEALAAKAFRLNRALHGLDAFYSIRLPEIFLFVHPIGTVLGNAEYGDYFVVYQGCLIGATEDGRYPRFGRGVVLFSQAGVLGPAIIGDDVVFGSRSFLVGGEIASKSTVVGAFPSHRILPNDAPTAERIFNDRGDLGA